MKQKLTLSFVVIVLVFAALVGYSISTYSGSIVKAQVPPPTISATQKEPNAEIQGGAISIPKPSGSPSAIQKNDTNENDKADNGISPEVEDGN